MVLLVNLPREYIAYLLIGLKTVGRVSFPAFLFKEYFMALFGKYNFKGIKKQGAEGLKLALASSPATIWIAKIPLINNLLEPFVNWLANNGLVILNIGAIYVNGKVDQSLLDRSIDEGLKKVQNSNGNLTPEQIKEIDNAVIEAANRALPYTK